MNTPIETGDDVRKTKILTVAAGFGLVLVTAATVVALHGGDHTGAAAGPPAGAARTGDTYQDQLTDLRTRQTSQLNAAVVDCMKKAGFTYVTPTPAANPRNSLSPRQDLLQYGYGVNTAPVINPAPDPNAGYLATLPGDRVAAYHVALQGPATGNNNSASSGGCLAANNDRYLRGLSSVISRFETSREQMYQQLSTDPRMVTVQRQWATCLAAAGYDYATPQAIVDGLTRDTTHGDHGSPQARAHELAVAGADSDCRDRYVQPTYQAVLTEYLARSAAGDQRLLAEARQAVSQA